jgi:hypothetical protein
MSASARRSFVALQLAAALLAACDARTLIGARLAREEVAFGAWVVERLAAGDRASIEASFDRGALDGSARARIDGVAGTFPAAAPLRVELTDWTVRKPVGGPTEWEIEMTSRYPDAALVTRIVYRKAGPRRDLTRLRVTLERRADPDALLTATD